MCVCVCVCVGDDEWFGVGVLRLVVIVVMMVTVIVMILWWWKGVDDGKWLFLL